MTNNMYLYIGTSARAFIQAAKYSRAFQVLLPVEKPPGLDSIEQNLSVDPLDLELDT